MQYVKVYLCIFCGNCWNLLVLIYSSGCYYAHLYEWKRADQYWPNPVSILAKVGRWNDPRDLSSRSSFPGSALYFPTPFVWSRSSITLEWQWDGRQIKDGFSFSLQEVLFCPDGSEKKLFSLRWTVMKVSPSFERLNLTWGDVSKMVACPAPWWAALFWKACWGSIYHNLLPQCRSRWYPSRTSSGTHLHFRPLPGCNPITCRSDLLWWIHPLKQKHFTSTDVRDKWRHLSPESWPLGTLL